ncbi:hypothetical protein COOONC_27773 [Cooperia oncophora]
MDNPKKMLLYSSHDGTLLSLMYAMGVGNNLMVPYASALIMEIYKEGKDFQVELLFRNETTRPPYKLAIPNCGSPCTVDNMANQFNSMRLDSYAEQQKLCGTPLAECKSSSPMFSYVLGIALSMTFYFR